MARTATAVLMTAMMALSAVPAARADALRDRAHQELTTAQGEFAAGHFDVALEHLQRAYALAPHPELLFNIARCLEELHRTGAAVEAYDRYLAVQPNDAMARERVATLRSQILTSPPTPTELAITPPAPIPTATTAGVVATQAPAARRPLHRRWWLWTTVASVVVAGAGIGLAVGLTRPATSPTFPPLTAQ